MNKHLDKFKIFPCSFSTLLNVMMTLSPFLFKCKCLRSFMQEIIKYYHHLSFLRTIKCCHRFWGRERQRCL